VKKLNQLLDGLLPAGFEQIKREAPRVQKFLQQDLPEPVAQSITLLRIDAEEIVIAAHSPMMANYLRMHCAGIQLRLQRALGLERVIKVCTRPHSLLKVASASRQSKPPQVSPQAVDLVARGATAIEDHELKIAMLSLAKSLQERDG